MKIFLTGASGYIGGSVANALVKYGHRVTGLTRSDAHAAALVARGIEPVIGPLDDSALLIASARQADAVINAANADHRPSVEAMLTALDWSGKPFVQTSGSGIVADLAGGLRNDAIYEDDTPVTPVPGRAARVATNQLVLASIDRGIRGIVIAPPMIYGRGSGLNPNSIQIPKLIATAKKDKVAKYVGAGENIWSNVHIDDLVDLYLIVLNLGRPGAFFYAENGECSMREIAGAISRMLGFRGRTQSLTVDEAIAEFGEFPALYSFGSNSRVRATRARRELGWAPSCPSLLDEIERGSYREAEAQASSTPRT